MKENDYLPKILFSILLCFTLLLAACKSLSGFGLGQPASNGTPLAPLPGSGNSDRGLAAVENIEIQIMESFPVQVVVLASIILPDDCTTIGQTFTEFDGSTFMITIFAHRPGDVICNAGTNHFESAFSLDVSGLKAGVYIVDVNGVMGSFELAVDNQLPPEPSPIPSHTPTPPPTPLPATPTQIPPTPSATALPCNRADFVTDLSVPDYSAYAPGTSFTKSWRLRNAGSCTWTSDYDLMFANGHAMTGDIELALPASVRPGETGDHR